MKKPIITGIVTAGLIVSMSVPVFAAELTIREQVQQEIKHTQQVTQTPTKASSFKDVLQGDSTHFGWAYDSVMAMATKGLFKGKGDIVNGIGVFAPADTMTRAEFVTVVVRAMYPDADTTPTTSNWWSGTYDVAVTKGLIKSSEFSESSMSQGMTRQEMAMVLVRAAEQKGDTPTQLIDTGRIGDYASVGSYYKDFVRKAYSLGMLCGVDDRGTYAPLGTLNRAAGATVLYRLVEPSARQKVDFSAPITPPVNGPITIYEGQSRTNRLAKAGDTVIKADGTKVVLKIGKDGVLGQDQGVAPDLGFKLFEGEVGEGGSSYGQIVENQVNVATLRQDLLDSFGKSINVQKYKVNLYTGEGHFALEWEVIAKNHPKPEKAGTKNGQLSADTYWVWIDLIEDWNLACNGSRKI